MTPLLFALLMSLSPTVDSANPQGENEAPALQEAQHQEGTAQEATASSVPSARELAAGTCGPAEDTCGEVFKLCRQECRQAGCPAASIDPCNLAAPCLSPCECICF